MTIAVTKFHKTMAYSFKLTAKRDIRERNGLNIIVGKNVSFPHTEEGTNYPNEPNVIKTIQRIFGGNPVALNSIPTDFDVEAL